MGIGGVRGATNRLDLRPAPVSPAFGIDRYPVTTNRQFVEKLRQSCPPTIGGLGFDGEDVFFDTAGAGVRALHPGAPVEVRKHLKGGLSRGGSGCHGVHVVPRSRFVALPLAIDAA